MRLVVKKDLVLQSVEAVERNVAVERKRTTEDQVAMHVWQRRELKTRWRCKGKQVERNIVRA